MQKIFMVLLILLFVSVIIIAFLFIKIKYLDKVNNNELPPLIFKNFQEAKKYWAENLIINDINYDNIFDELYKQIGPGSGYSLMGYYHSNGGVVLADLDKDGIYELYSNASYGSGYIHFLIRGYNPINKRYYMLSDRFGADYSLFMYKSNMYVYATREIYKPSLVNDELVLEKVEESLNRKIMKKISSYKFYEAYKIK